jgi:hypothetical protein
MYNWLVHFGLDRIIGGDYAKFDKSMSALVLIAAWKVIINVYKAAGHSEKHIAKLWCIAYDSIFTFCNFNGTLMQFFASNPSGHPLTVVINGIANCLYMRYAYTILNPEHEATTFRENVHLMTYGDDNGMGVSENVPWFNHTSIQEVLANCGIKYTMADKLAESVPYIHISNFTFLKRSWRWEPELNSHTCPLDHDSIEKMLMVTVKSKSVTPEFQMATIIRSALGEYFFYGKEIFEKKRILLMRIAQEIELDYFGDWMYPTWDDLKCQYRESSRKVDLFYEEL